MILIYLMVLIDLEIVFLGLSLVCYFCGFIVILDKLFYFIWLCIFFNNGLVWVFSIWNELDMIMNKYYSWSSFNCLFFSRGCYRLYRFCKRVMLCRGCVKLWEEIYFVCKIKDFYFWFFFWKYFFLIVKR